MLWAWFSQFDEHEHIIRAVANLTVDYVKDDLAAELISSADAVIVTAGAGMGVDSGLPDFRSTEGFWQNYPGPKPTESSFEKIARPSTFVEDLGLAWAFYGQRQRLYCDTEPHPGFTTLLNWCKAMSAGYFVYTSNVDGHFQKAGFRPDGVFECHGNIFWLQCLTPCTRDLWIAEKPAPQGWSLPALPGVWRPDATQRPYVRRLYLRIRHCRRAVR